MKSVRRIARWFGGRRREGHRVLGAEPSRQLILSQASVEGLRQCLLPEIERSHEGIAYLYGRTDGSTTLVLGALRPHARTTTGSFEVSALAMAKVVRKVSNMGLQVVGQAHTHPGRAFHSDGDERGAQIVYQGFVSLVAPDHGRHLPSLGGCVTYFFDRGKFLELSGGDLRVVPGAVL